MVKHVIFTLLGVGALYFGMGQMNEPVWTEFQSATGEFRLEFPDSDPPKTRGTLRGDCLEGKIFYVDSRHGPFKIHGVLSEAGRLNLNSRLFGCKLTVEGAFNELRSITLAKYGGDLVEEKEFDFYGNPGREFVIDAGFEKSRVLQRVISIDRYTYYTQLFQYPQNTDYAAWSRRFFDSFDFIE